jgi:hypothetical protein
MQMPVDIMSIDYRPPWESRLFVLYLIVVVTTALVRSISVVRHLWSSRRVSALKSVETGEGAEREFLFAWEVCLSKVRSIRRLVFLTLLVSVLVAAYEVRNILSQIAWKELLGPSAISGSLSEVLTLFWLGVLVSALLYAACAYYEGALAHRRTFWKNRFVGR